MIRTLSSDRARELSARCLSDALEATDTSNAMLARHLHVDERLVRDLRAGLRPITGERVLLLPARVRAEYLQRLAALDADPLPGALTAEGQAQVALASMGELLVAEAHALADQVLTPTEAQALLPPVRRTVGALRALEERLEALAGGSVLRAVGR